MLSLKSLRKADILLSTGDSLISRLIRGATVSSYSHAALYMEGSEVIEAVSEGVIKQPLGLAMKNDSLVSVYRRIRMSPEQGDMVVRYCLQQVGKPYDLAGAAGAGYTSGSGFVIGLFVSPIITTGLGVADLVNRLNPTPSFFCSELVAIAFHNAGVPIVSAGAASSTPRDISRSHVLNYIGDLKIQKE